MGGRGSGTWVIIWCFPQCALAGSWVRAEAGLKPRCSDRGCRCPSADLTHCTVALPLHDCVSCPWFLYILVCGPPASWQLHGGWDPAASPLNLTRWLVPGAGGCESLPEEGAGPLPGAGTAQFLQHLLLGACGSLPCTYRVPTCSVPCQGCLLVQLCHFWTGN